jgi:parvulin-like peptidyl-prolyl isomerase
MRPSPYLLLCSLLLLSLAAGCAPQEADMGVVARINGQPILLRQLESRYDLNQLGGMNDLSPSVSRLRLDYGQILGDLIIQELIAQELKSRKLSITDEDVAKAEQEVRRDYPEGAFEQVLIEEYIDLEEWRNQLRAKLALDRFTNGILRPRIQIGVEEAKAYYNEHVDDFYLPPLIEFLVFRSASRADLEKAMQLYSSANRTDSISGILPQVQVHKLKMREDRLPPTWHMAMKELQQLSASAILTDRSGFQVFIPLERTPGKVLDPSSAYPLVERIMVEKKMREIFDEWLQAALSTAKIQVSVHLLEEFLAKEKHVEEHS